MPLKLNVGLSKKVGLPNYGSLGASCHVEVELDGSLLDGDLERLHQHVRRAYVACAQAVNDELTRHQPAGAAATNGAAASASNSANGNGSRAPRRSSSGPRRATHSQVRAINAIAERQGIDLAALLQERFSTRDPADLSITEASQLIDELKSSANGTGGQR